jgi:hypothetical protein
VDREPIRLRMPRAFWLGAPTCRSIAMSVKTHG